MQGLDFFFLFNLEAVGFSYLFLKNFKEVIWPKINIFVNKKLTSNFVFLYN